MSHKNPFTRENNHTISKKNQRELLSASYIKLEEELKRYMKNDTEEKTNKWRKSEVGMVGVVILVELALICWLMIYVG